MFSSLLILASMLPAQASTPGDVDGNGCINQADVECLSEVAVAELSGGAAPECQGVRTRALDFNRDGAVNVVDIVRLGNYVNASGGTCDCTDSPEVGDVDGDCSVTSADLDCTIEALVADLFGSAYPECLAVSFDELDFNQDGEVNIVDIQIMNLHLSQG